MRGLWQLLLKFLGAMLYSVVAVVVLLFILLFKPRKVLEFEAQQTLTITLALAFAVVASLASYLIYLWVH